MSAIDDYYKQLQTLNEQRRMTGNVTQNRGMDASLAEGYMDAQYNQQNKQQAINLQRQNQAWTQAYHDKALNQQSYQFTTGLAGKAVGGLTNIATTGKLSGLFGGKSATPAIADISTDWGGTPQNMDYTSMGEAGDWASEVNKGVEESLSNFDWGKSFDFLDGLFLI